MGARLKRRGGLAQATAQRCQQVLAAARVAKQPASPTGLCPSSHPPTCTHANAHHHHDRPPGPRAFPPLTMRCEGLPLDRCFLAGAGESSLSLSSSTCLLPSMTPASQSKGGQVVGVRLGPGKLRDLCELQTAVALTAHSNQPQSTTENCSLGVACQRCHLPCHPP